LSATKVLRDNVQVFDGEKLAKGWAIVSDGIIEQAVQGKYSADGSGLENNSTPGFVSPGLIDTHIHGGGGFSADGSYQDMVKVIDFHQGFGVRKTLLSLVSAPIEQILVSIEHATALQKSDDRFLGLHLEGPFLAQSHKGAHDPAVLHAPSDQEIEKLIDKGAGVIKSITIAPELSSPKQISMLLEAGIQPCLGHTNADYELSTTHFNQGSRVLTHAFNGMNGIHHRAPGPVVAALDNKPVFSELIADGVHVRPEAARLLDPERVILITDAMSATGLPDGTFNLGSLAVEVVEGVARTHSGSLAGSTLTLDVGVKNFANWFGSVELAFRAAITNPAKAYGLKQTTLAAEDRPILWSESLMLESVSG
jgi:N-acetylglucosamine-6-phosphate deacetylase